VLDACPGEFDRTVTPATVRPRRPALYRAASAFIWLRWAAAVALAVYVATAAYSASELRPASSGVTTTAISGVELEVRGFVNLSNPGWYPVNSLVLQSRIALPDGAPVANGSSPVIVVAPSSTATVAVPLVVALTDAGPLVFLATHDTRLVAKTWANATYAGLFRISARSDWNYSWGAPFAGLGVVPGTPVQANGTFELPVRATFENHAPFADRGTLGFSVTSAAGAICTSGSFALDVPSQGSYDRTVYVPISTTCDPSHGQVRAHFVGPNFDLALPPEPIP
jgi:hypothetical protein